MSSAERYWRALAQWEKVHKSNARRCQRCTALMPHPGVSCEEIRERLAWSAANQYNRADPWAWPPLELYAPGWRHA
jgi:hypothetical protein